jgi:Holliday junction resolvase
VSHVSLPREEATLKKIARQYSAEGYEVFIAPTASKLPESLRNYQVDLLCKRGEETVIVEVKTSGSEKLDPKLHALAEAVSRIPNYRFDFIAATKDPRPRKTEWLTAEELSILVNEATRLQHMDLPTASVMLLWSATEGTLRLLAAQERISAEVQNPAMLIKNLYSNGVLDKDQYSVFQRAVRYRNAAAHAYKIESIDEAFFRRWTELTTDLLRLTKSQ